METARNTSVCAWWLSLPHIVTSLNGKFSSVGEVHCDITPSEMLPSPPLYILHHTHHDFKYCLNQGDPSSSHHWAT